jgi:hypothetical protein
VAWPRFVRCSCLQRKSGQSQVLVVVLTRALVSAHLLLSTARVKISVSAVNYKSMRDDAVRISENIVPKSLNDRYCLCVTAVYGRTIGWHIKRRLSWSDGSLGAYLRGVRSFPTTTTKGKQKASRFSLDAGSRCRARKLMAGQPVAYVPACKPDGDYYSDVDCSCLIPYHHVRTYVYVVVSWSDVCQSCSLLDPFHRHFPYTYSAPEWPHAHAFTLIIGYLSLSSSSFF